MHILTKRLKPYTFIVISYMLIFMGLAVQTHNIEFLFYGGTMIIILLLIIHMDKRVQFGTLVLSGLSLWGFLHLAGGVIPVPAAWVATDDLTPVLYDVRPISYLPKYDQVVHALGFGVSLLAAYEALQAHFKKALPLNLPIASTLLLVAMGLGAVNELIEFAAVVLIPNTNVGGYMNTGWDLVSNATGALIALLYLRLKAGKVST